MAPRKITDQEVVVISSHVGLFLGKEGISMLLISR